MNYTMTTVLYYRDIISDGKILSKRKFTSFLFILGPLSSINSAVSTTNSYSYTCLLMNMSHGLCFNARSLGQVFNPLSKDKKV